MRKLTVAVFLLLIAISVGLIGCGGGGRNAETSNNPPNTTAKTKATVFLSLNGSSIGATIGGADVTLRLPVGVSVKSSVSPITDAGVVVAASQMGANPYVYSTYDASNNTVQLIVLSQIATGFSSGSLATVHCDIASGYNPAPALFAIVTSTVSDINFNLIPDMIASASVVIE